MPPELATYLVLGLGFNLVHIQAIDLSMEWRRYDYAKAAFYWYKGNIGKEMRQKDIDNDLIAGGFWWPCPGCLDYETGELRKFRKRTG